ncbi:MAG: hypothetical protein WDW38_003920 [Sanguina aurantia]
MTGFFGRRSRGTLKLLGKYAEEQLASGARPPLAWEDPFDFWTFLVKRLLGLSELVMCHANLTLFCECGHVCQTVEELPVISLSFQLAEVSSPGPGLSLESKLQSFFSKRCDGEEDMWDCPSCRLERPPTRQQQQQQHQHSPHPHPPHPHSPHQHSQQQQQQQNQPHVSKSSAIYRLCAHVHAQDAYLLFYTRQQMIPPGDALNQVPGSDKAHAESMGADDVMDVSSCGPTTEGNTAEVGSEHAPGSVHLNSGNDASSCGPGGSSLTGGTSTSEVDIECCGHIAKLLLGPMLVLYKGETMSPSAFEAVCGRASFRVWRVSLK